MLTTTLGAAGPLLSGLVAPSLSSATPFAIGLHQLVTPSTLPPRPVPPQGSRLRRVVPCIFRYIVCWAYSTTGPAGQASRAAAVQMSELAERITKNEIKPKQRYLIFEVCCADEEGEDVDTPYCRYQFR